MMKTFRYSKNPLRLGICNFERVDEEKLFRYVLDFLGKNEEVELEKVKEYPYCQMVDGKCHTGTFTVVFDFVEGTEITCGNHETISFLEEIFR